MKSHKNSKLAQIIRHKIQYFLSYFQDYLYYNSVENAWKSLLHQSKSATNFQELTQVDKTSNFKIYLLS